MSRRRQTRRAPRWLLTASMLGASMLLAFACGNSETEPEGKCDPGTNVFCRCPGGDPGTRECQDNGEDFDECVVAPGTPCGERVECVEGSTVPCLCPSGEAGLKECLRDEASYGECMVSAGVPCPSARMAHRPAPAPVAVRAREAEAARRQRATTSSVRPATH